MKISTYVILNETSDFLVEDESSLWMKSHLDYFRFVWVELAVLYVELERAEFAACLELLKNKTKMCD
jgi:hypothetical protein